MKTTTPIHLDAVGISKLTLSRWLSARESLPGGKKAWATQRELINRRTKSYTREEIDLLLDLGRGDYAGFKGINKKAATRLSAHVACQRHALVTAAAKKLSKLK